MNSGKVHFVKRIDGTQTCIINIDGELETYLFDESDPAVMWELEFLKLKGVENET